MNASLFRSILLSLCLGLFIPMSAQAGNAEVADQVRQQWTKATQAYTAAVQPYASNPQYAPLVKEFSATLDSTGQALEQYIKLRLASPPPAPALVTPVIDQLIKNMGKLRSLGSKASGKLVTVLGTALNQHSQATQTALKNMR